MKKTCKTCGVTQTIRKKYFRTSGHPVVIDKMSRAWQGGTCPDCLESNKTLGPKEPLNKAVIRKCRFCGNKTEPRSYFYCYKHINMLASESSDCFDNYTHYEVGMPAGDFSFRRYS